MPQRPDDNDENKIFVIHFRAEKDCADPIKAVRELLKRALRNWKLTLRFYFNPNKRNTTLNYRTLKFLHPRGFGFIINDAGGTDDFVHAKDMEASGINTDVLENGKTRLSYEMALTPKGDKAVNLRMIEA